MTSFYFTKRFVLPVFVPGLEPQRNLPGKLVHVSFMLHGLFVLHSSISSQTIPFPE